jgi:hypothetical protein
LCLLVQPLYGPAGHNPSRRLPYRPAGI